MASLPDDKRIDIRLFSGTEMVVLWVTISLAVLFIGALVYDQIRRRKRTRRPGEPRESFRATLGRPFQRLSLLRQELRALSRERSRRKQRDERKPPSTKR